MSALANVLYPAPDYRRTPLSTLRWWESRRLTYNKVVGGAGLVTLAGVAFFCALPPFSSFILRPELLVGVGMYAFMANVCYTLGWQIELVARRVLGRNGPDLGPILFRQGLIFSVGLTLLPLLVAAMLWIARSIAWIVA